MKTRSSVLILAAGIVSLIGCGKQSSPPLDVLVGIDVSGSARPCLGGYVAPTLQLAERLTPDQDRLTVVRLDRDTRVVREGKLDGDVEGLAHTLRHELQPAAHGGTLPAAFWAVAAHRVQKAQQEGRGSVVLLLTDGDNDALNTRPQLRQAVQSLATQKGLRTVVLAGIDAHNRATLESDLAPLKTRLQPLLGPTELSADKVLAFLSESGR